MSRRLRICCALAGLLCPVLPSGAFAQEPDTCRHSSGSTQVVIDGEELGAIVGDVVEDLATVLADLQVEVRMGQDNRMNVSVQDKTYELDIDAILEQVSVALEAGLQEMETEDWTSVTVRRDHEATAEELRVELDDLRAELQDLQKELSRLRDRD